MVFGLAKSEILVTAIERRGDRLADPLASVLGSRVRVRARGRGASVQITFDELRDAQELARRLSGRLAA